MKRRAYKLVLFLLALLVGGAIINVAVAWGCALANGSASEVQRHIQSPAFQMHIAWPNVNPRVQKMLLDEGWSAPRDEQFDRLFLAPTQRSAFGFKQRSFTLYYQYLVNEKAVWTGPVYLPVLSEPVVVQIELGWPLPSLAARQLHDSSTIKNAGSVVHKDSVTFPELVGFFPNSGGYRVPLAIEAMGFAINTIFYAAILWILFAVPGAVRRRVRRKRGQCAACGYLLRGCDTSGGEKCSECGAAFVRDRSTRERRV